MKKITTKVVLGVFVLGSFLLSSCSKNTQLQTSNYGSSDIVWKNQSAVSEASKVIVSDESNVQSEVSIESKTLVQKPQLKERQQKRADKILTKIEKKINSMSPQEKVELKKKVEKLKSSKGSDGLKKGVITILVGIGICIVAALFYGILALLGTLVYVIGAIVVLYGIYLLLEEFVL